MKILLLAIKIRNRTYEMDYLGKSGSEKAIELLIPLLKDQYVRWHAASALCKIFTRFSDEKRSIPVETLWQNCRTDQEISRGFSEVLDKTDNRFIYLHLTSEIARKDYIKIPASIKLIPELGSIMKTRQIDWSNEHSPVLAISLIEPNSKEVTELMSKARELSRVKEFLGYQSGIIRDVFLQFRSIFVALQDTWKGYTVGSGSFTGIQNIPPFRDIIKRGGNCLDTCLLLCSVCDVAGLATRIILIDEPNNQEEGHAILGIEAIRDTEVCYLLETTSVGELPFEIALKQGKETYESASQDSNMRVRIVHVPCALRAIQDVRERLI